MYFSLEFKVHQYYSIFCMLKYQLKAVSVKAPSISSIKAWVWNKGNMKVSTRQHRSYTSLHFFILPCNILSSVLETSFFISLMICNLQHALTPL